MPPLGLLSVLAQDKPEEDDKGVLTMTDRLKSELAEMLAEHEAIVMALQNLIAVSKAENKPEHARFAEKLMLHAQTEEEVLYPAAILVGEYLKLKLGPDRQPKPSEDRSVG